MSYDLFLEPEVHDARLELPGNLRQRVRRAIDNLRATPRPAESQILDVSNIDLPPGIELRRTRIDRWRIIYAVNDADQSVGLAVGHPPSPTLQLRRSAGACQSPA
jgi:mRNA interferase RelE/StbE